VLFLPSLGNGLVSLVEGQFSYLNVCIRMPYNAELKKLLDHSTGQCPSDWILPLFKKILNELLAMCLGTNQTSILGNFRPVLRSNNLQYRRALFKKEKVKTYIQA
jgi:hypothetical protein